MALKGLLYHLCYNVGTYSVNYHDTQNKPCSPMFSKCRVSSHKLCSQCYQIWSKFPQTMFPRLPNVELVPTNHVPSVIKCGVSSHKPCSQGYQMWSQFPQTMFPRLPNGELVPTNHVPSVTKYEVSFHSQPCSFMVTKYGVTNHKS